MSALTSLLVRDRVVPLKKIEEAIQRQVISGGALDTVLLEVGATRENVLASYCAAVFELQAVAAGDLMNVTREVVRLVPREVAEQHRVVPIESHAGRVVLAVHEPLARDVEQQLAFLLGASIEQRVTTQARLEAALGAHYGVELSPRLKRLGRKLADAPAGDLVDVAPLDDNRRTVPDDLAPAAIAEADQRPEATYAARTGSTAKYGQVPEAPRRNSAVAVNVARVVGADALERKSFTADAPTPELAEPGSDVTTPRVTNVPETFERASRVTLTDLAAQAKPNAQASREPEASSSTEAASPRMERPPRTELLSRIRGPFTARLAVELLEQAGDREEVLQVALAFVRQFFDCAVLFLVQDDIAEGLDVEGAGPDYATVRRTTVSVEDAGILSDAFRTAQPRMGDLESGTRADQSLAKALGRDTAQPCVVAPVAIRQRVVLLFYGDRGGEDFGISDVPEFVAFMPRISEAFQRLILRRKMGKAAPAEEPDDAKGSTAKRWQGGRRNWVAEVSHTPRGRAPKRRTQAMDVLGVPRTAPPPPSPVANAAGAHAVPPQDAPGVPEAPEDPEPAYLGVPEVAPGSEDDVGHAQPAERTAGESLVASPSSGSTLLDGAEAALDEGSSSSDPEGVESSPAPTEDEPDLTAIPLTNLRPTEPALALDPDEVVSADALRKRGGVTVQPAIRVVDSERARATARAIAEQMVTGSVGSTPPPEAPVRAVASVRPAGGVYSMKGTTDVVATSRSSRPPPPRERDAVRAESPNTSEREPTRPAIAPLDDDDDEPELTVTEAAVHSSAGSHSANARVVVDPGMPSVILDLGDGVENAVQQLLHAGPEDTFAVQAALRAGEGILPALVREFPGPLWFDRHAPHQRLPRGRDVSAVARAMVAFGDVAVPYVAALLDREDPDVRFYATLLSAELVHRDLVGPLGRRVFDVDSGTRVLALDVLRPLRRFPREFGRVIDRVRASARIPARPLPIRLAALKALGHLRDDGALNLLSRVLDVDEPKLREAAHQSLVLITRQDFGKARDAWEDWIAEHSGEHRIEWLIDALMNDDAKLRRLAGDELKHLTQAYYGYQHALPKRDREVAQRKYRKWWDTEGRALFGAVPQRS
ncbi:MAG: hypothetical protein R3B40_02405 [Polyangiales bacterium]